MSKKDYELIASVCKIQYLTSMDRTCVETVALRRLIESLATRLQDENKKFDRNKFLQACGISLDN